MALNGIQITTRIPESVIEGIAEYVADGITEDYSEEACDREGTDRLSLIRKLQADADFRKAIELEMLSVINDAVQEPCDYDVPQTVFDEMMHNQPNNWIAEYVERLQLAEDTIEQEELLQQEAKEEKTVAEQVAFLESQGYLVRQTDPRLNEALRTVNAAGYTVERKEEV